MASAMCVAVVWLCPARPLVPWAAGEEDRMPRGRGGGKTGWRERGAPNEGVVRRCALDRTAVMNAADGGGTRRNLEKVDRRAVGDYQPPLVDSHASGVVQHASNVEEDRQGVGIERCHAATLLRKWRRASAALLRLGHVGV